MFGSILVLFLVPWFDRSTIRSDRYRPVYKQFMWLLVVDCVLLTYAGGQPPERVWLVARRFGAAYDFLHFRFVLPVVSIFEQPRDMPMSIVEPVNLQYEAGSAR